MLDQTLEHTVEPTDHVLNVIPTTPTSDETYLPSIVKKGRGAAKLNSPRMPRIKPKKPAPRQTVQALLNSANPVTTTCTYLVPVSSQLDTQSRLHDSKTMVGSSILGLNSIVPINITPATTNLPSISAIALPAMLQSPMKTNITASTQVGADSPACLEDYVTSIVGQSLGHLGGNISSADLVDKVTQVLKALSSTKDGKHDDEEDCRHLEDEHDEGHSCVDDDRHDSRHAQRQEHNNSSPLGFYGSSDSDHRFHGGHDPHWSNMQNASQSSGASQILESFVGAVAGGEAGKHYSGEEGVVLPLEEGVVLPLEVVNGVLKPVDQGEGHSVVSSVSAEMLDLIIDSVTLAATPGSKTSHQSLEEVTHAELIQLHPSAYCEAVTTEYYCVECDVKYASQPCEAHGTPCTSVADSPILSAARSSVPAVLEVGKSRVASGEEGVFAREAVCKKSRFGPLIGERRALNPGEEPDGQFVWLNSRKTGVICCVDENKSNWMRFVQLARNRAEQNVVAFMENEQIYMVTCRDVEPNIELKLWYSADYSSHIGITPIACPTLKCDTCNRRLTSKTQLNQHRNYCHPDEAKHRCAYCTSEFVTAIALQNHCRRHLADGTSEKGGALKCGYCEKTFNNAGNLKVHMRIHTGEKRYSCDVCSRSFTQHAHLRSHLLTHSKIKNYICHYCSKTFARTCDLKIHERVHTRQNIMRCDECGKEFFKLDNYKCHQKIHLNQKDFACVGCGKAFSKKYHLVRHLRTCKGNNKVER